MKLGLVWREIKWSEEQGCWGWNWGWYGGKEWGYEKQGGWGNDGVGTTKEDLKGVIPEIIRQILAFVMTTIKSEAVARVLDEEVKMGEKNVADEKEEEEGTEKTDALSASFIEDLKEDLEFKSNLHI